MFLADSTKMKITKEKSRFLFRFKDAQSSSCLRQGWVSKIHLAESDLIQGWAPLIARLYVCWRDPEPGLAFFPSLFFLSLLHRELTPAFNHNKRSRVGRQSRCVISWETAENNCDRSACWSSNLAEVKFKSHNKIACHREAINGGRFNTDAWRVLRQLLRLKWKLKWSKNWIGST